MSVNISTRIIDKPEKEEAENDDYILLDSPTLGTRRISIENLTGGVTNGETNT